MQTREARASAERPEAERAGRAEPEADCRCELAEERRRLELGLRLTEQRFQALVQNSSDIIAILEADGAICYVSPSVIRILGHDPAALVGTHLLEHVHPEDRPALEAFLRYGTEGSPAGGRCEGRFLHRDGSWRYLEGVSANLLQDPRVAGIVMNLRDVTERKLAEQRLRLVATGARCLLWHAEIEERDGALRWRTVMADEEAAQRVLPLEHTPGESYAAAWHRSRLEEDRARSDAYAAAEVRAGRSYSQEFRCRRADGAIRWLKEDVEIERLAPNRWRAIGVCVDITERKLAEEALRSSEERYRSLIENAADMVVLLDGAGRIGYASPAVARVLGYSPADLCGQDAFELIHPKDRPRALHLFQQLLERPGSPAAIEYRARHADGSWRVIETTATNLLPDPNVRSVVVNSRDITERRRAEEALRESEQFVRGTLDALSSQIAVLDERGEILAVNAAWRRLVGANTLTPAGALVGANYLALCEAAPGSEGPAVAAGIRAVLSGTRHFFALEYRLPRPEAEPEWYVIRVHRFAAAPAEECPESGGPPAGAAGAGRAVLSIANITARVEADASRAQKAAILDATTDLVTTADVSGRVLYMNRACRRMLGIADEAEVRDQIMPAGYPEWAWKQIAEVGIPTAMREGAWSGETAVLRPDGTEVPVSLVILAHRNADGRIEFLSTIARDISEQKQLEEQLRQSQKMDAIGRLAGGIAHDFNNMLAVINGYSGLLLERAAPDDPNRQFYADILQAGERAAALTRQLLAFSRKQVLSSRLIDLNATVERMEQMLQRLIGEDIELLSILDPQLHPVKGDPGQIEQVLLNLVVNARDAMPRGGRLTIRTRNVRLDARAARQLGAAAGPYVLLAVSDTGHGMDADTLSHIFEPFFTTKPPGKGTGLGLATVYGIVRQSGGQIRVESLPGEGTTFSVYLPRAEAPTERFTTSGTDARQGGTETVLLVEDEALVRGFVRDLLESCGYTVLAVSRGEEALQLCETHPGPIDLLLTDVVMPGMSGRELAEQLLPKRPQMRVLYMSGYTDDAVVRHGVLDEGIPFIQKPFTSGALARKVREVLEGGRAASG